jgi:hypothetical protein
VAVQFLKKKEKRNEKDVFCQKKEEIRFLILQNTVGTKVSLS